MAQLNLNLDRLQTFLVAAESLNFSQAGRILHLSQPAISQQMRELEESLGVRLFDRRGRVLALTSAGERLKAHARAILRAVSVTVDDMKALAGNYQGVIRIGATNTLGIYLLPYALGHYSLSHPGVKTSVRVADLHDVVRGLEERELDMAFVDEDLSPDRIFGWHKVPLMTDEIVIATLPHHPWARDGVISIDRLPESPFILRTEGRPIRNLVRKRLAEAGFNPERLVSRFELGNMEGIKRAVMAGLGVGFVSRSAMRLEFELGLLSEVRIDSCPITRTLWLIQESESSLPPHVEDFSQLLQSGSWLNTPPWSAETSAPSVD